MNKLRQAVLKQSFITDRIVLVCSFVSVIIFPIMEGIIIQKYHAKPGFLYWIVSIGIAHLVIGGITIVNTKTLPQFASEYDDLEKRYSEKLNEKEYLQQLLTSSTFAVEVVQLSLAALRDIMSGNNLFAKESVQKSVEFILRPLINLRTEVLGFTAAEARYNFAVYLHDKDEDKLKILFRECDDRIEQKNRSWSPGVGHVGICYSQKATIISPDIYNAPELWQGGEDSDKDNYRSMASTPIFADSDTVLGVLIITSSYPNQLSEEKHATLLKSLSSILSVYFKFVHEHSR